MDFRIIALAMADASGLRYAYPLSNQKLSKDFKKIKTREQVLALMAKFLCANSPVRANLVDRLKQIRTKLEQSSMFRTHEFIGSSILIVYDDAKVGAWMIDFAKVRPVQDASMSLNHRTPWSIGNHEDGYLFGIDNLVQIVEDTALLELAQLS